MRHRITRLSTVITVALALVVTGCSSNEDDGDQSPGNATFDEVTYVTGFGLLGREAYMWVAMDQGFFEDEGIKLTIEAGFGSEQNLALAASGQAEFVAVDIPGALIVYSQGELQDFTIVSAVQQRSLIAIMAKQSSGITAPTDLAGRTIGMQPGSVAELLFPTYASVAGFDPESVTFESVPPQELAGALAGGRVDAISQFTVGQTLVETITGEPAVVLPYSEFLTDLYGGGIATSTRLAQENPDLVHRFNRALFRGLEYALNDPEGAAEIMGRYVEEIAGQLKVAAAEMAALQAYVQPPEAGQPFGIIDEQRFARGIALLEAAGAIEPGLTPQDLVSFDLVPGAA